MATLAAKPESNSDEAPLIAQVLVDRHDWVLTCFVDVLPKQVAFGRNFELGGVVVLSRKAPAGFVLKLEGKGRTMPVEWNLRSPLMEQQYQQGVNSANARFLVKDVEFHSGEESLVLTLYGPNNMQLAVAEILRPAPPQYHHIFVEPQNRLIFDVGANDGQDTWYYLRKGFRVVAIEAIPELAANLRKLFREQIAAGRLVVEPVAITEKNGEVNLTINQDRPEWSSAHSAPKASAGSNCTITVPSNTLAHLIAQHGSPYYIKIDIEGGELSAIDSLQGVVEDKLPPFLSFELNPEWGEVLEHLYQMGYRRFQMVRQGAQHLQRLAASNYEGVDYRCGFTHNMSGPFGRDLPNHQWVGLVEIIRRILQSQAAIQESNARGESPGWFDVHAARE